MACHHPRVLAEPLLQQIEKEGVKVSSNPANDNKSSGRNRTALVTAALALALFVGGWLLWQSVRGSFSNSDSTPIHFPPELAQLISQPFWPQVRVFIEGKGEVRIFGGYSSATVPQCVMEVQRTPGSIDLHFGYRVQSPLYGAADQRLMGLAVAIAYDPGMQVTDDLRQKIRQALPTYFSPRGTIDEVDDDTQDAWVKFAVAKTDADRHDAADKLLTMVIAWRDKWQGQTSHKEQAAAALTKVHSVIPLDEEQPLMDEWTALQQSRTPAGNRLAGWVRRMMPNQPATQPTSRPIRRPRTRPVTMPAATRPVG